MQRFKCIEKLRDSSGRIKEYILLDEMGGQLVVESDLLKAQIVTGCVEVVNLQLTSDNKLIDKALNEVPQTKAPTNTRTLNENLCKQFRTEMVDCANNYGITITKIPETTEINGSTVVFAKFDVRRMGEKNVLFSGAKTCEITDEKLDSLNEFIVGASLDTSNNENKTLLYFTVHVREVVNGIPNITDKSKYIEDYVNAVLDFYEAMAYQDKFNLIVKGAQKYKLTENMLKTKICGMLTTISIFRLIGVFDTIKDKEYTPYGYDGGVSKYVHTEALVISRMVDGKINKRARKNKGMGTKELNSGDKVYDTHVNKVREGLDKQIEQRKTSDKLKKASSIKGIFSAFKR